MPTAAPTAPNASNSKILLEAGTNEVEVLVFRVGGERYGVNVAKVREVLAAGEVTCVPEMHKSVDGLARVRETVVPVVNLARHFGHDDAARLASQDRLLLLEFNRELIAFRVQGVDRIYRVSWRDTQPMPSMPGVSAPVVSLVLLDGKIISLLDFELIGATIGLTQMEVPEKVNLSRDKTKPTVEHDEPIVFAEDSKMVFTLLQDTLASAGYRNVKGFGDGLAAWEYLANCAQNCPPGEIRSRVAGVISDIEMPRMDGFSLTRRIRGDAVLGKIPVVLFSSLVSADNEKKGQQVGATAQICKPMWADLTDTLMNVLADVL